MKFVFVPLDIMLCSNALCGVFAEHISIVGVISFENYKNKIVFGQESYSFQSVKDHKSPI